MVLLTTPGTRRISYTADPREVLGGAVHPERWRDLETVDGYAFVPVLPDDLRSGRQPQVRLDGGKPRGFSFSLTGQLGPAPPGEPSPTATPPPDPGATQVDWVPIRGLPQLLDSPETYPGLDLWGRLHGQQGRSAYGNPLWGGTLADGSRAVIAQPVIPFETPTHLVFAVNPPPVADTEDTFLVRDLPNPANPKALMQVSAYLPLSDGRCELVVVGKPGTTGSGTPRTGVPSPTSPCGTASAAGWWPAATGTSRRASRCAAARPRRTPGRWTAPGRARA
jgi:hypothetical protein